MLSAAGKQHCMLYCQASNVFAVYCLQLARITVSPFVYLFAIILVKRVIVGKFKAGPKTGQWPRFQYWLMSALVPSTSFGGEP